MASSSMTYVASNCSITLDAKFGPTIKGARGNFDFTLLFEDAFLAAVPSAALLLAIPFRTLWLYNSPKKVAPSSGRVNKVISAAA
jgi:ATP-binding cassette subfamily C (CFTR/MRP) protein 1